MISWYMYMDSDVSFGSGVTTNPYPTGIACIFGRFWHSLPGFESTAVLGKAGAGDENVDYSQFGLPWCMAWAGILFGLILVCLLVV